MDIRLIILRTVAFSLLVLIISATVVSLTLFLASLGITNLAKAVIAVILSILIVLILDPLKKGIAQLTDKLFFKAQVNYQQLLTNLSEIINREIDLDVLLYSLSRKLEKELKVKNASIYIAGVAGGAFFKRKGWVDSKGKRIELERLLKEEIEPENLEERISHTNPLVRYLHKERQTIVLEALERKIEDTKDEQQRKKLEQSKAALDQMDAAVVAPIEVGNNLNAILIMGPKLSGDPYSSEDLALLQLISPQLASALEKSRLYEDARQFTERLKKEVAIATEDVRNTNLQLNERNRFLTALQNVTNLITRSLDFTKVTQAIVDSIHQELGYTGGILLFLGKDRHKLFADAVSANIMNEQVKAALPAPIDKLWGDFRTSNSRSVRAIKSGEVQIGNDLGEFLAPAIDATTCGKLQKLLKIKTVISVPIFSEEISVGAVDFLLDRDPGTLKETDLSIMKALCSQIGIVYRNIQLYKQVEDSNKELAEANKHLQELDQAKSEFVSIASHQLRTPMTGIMGYLSMMLQGDFGKVPKQQSTVLEGLFEESRRMIRLINIFLNVTKIESGKLELTTLPLNIEEVIERVIEVLKKSAADKHLQLDYTKPKKALPLVQADKDKIDDVIQNLTDNAIKYTDEGSVIISAEQEGDFVHLAVTDTGRGIPAEEVNKLFTKFVRGYGIAQVNPDGSGLGLYVARRLTEAHGGKIWVESPGVGKGSSFHVTIPVAKKTAPKGREFTE